MIKQQIDERYLCIVCLNMPILKESIKNNNLGVTNWVSTTSEPEIAYVQSHQVEDELSLCILVFVTYFQMGMAILPIYSYQQLGIDDFVVKFDVFHQFEVHVKINRFIKRHYILI